MNGEATARVFLADHRPQVPLVLGPLPAVRIGNVVAFEMQAPDSYVAWPGGSLLERKYLLLDHGVSFGIPGWRSMTRPDGTQWSFPDSERHSWYVDLVTVEEQQDETFLVKDLFVDAIISEDGRHPRLLDLDELADAVEQGWIAPAVAFDGLRRWQRFLDEHLHQGRFPSATFADFPPRSISALAQMRGPLGPAVTWPE